MKRFVLAVVALALLASCSGSRVTQSAATPPLTSSSTTTTTTTASGPSVAGSLVIDIANPASASTSSAARKPNYVSPSSASVGVAINGATPTYYAVGTTSPYCTYQPPAVSLGSGFLSCTIPLAAPPGADTFALSFYDAANGTGKLLGTGTGTTTVTLGTAFAVTIPISPVVASASNPVVTYTSGTPFALGTAGTATLAFTLADPDGNAIPLSTTSIPATPSFASALTLSSSDPHVTVSPTSWTGPAQTVALTYDGSSAVARPNTVTLAAGSTVLATATLFPVIVSTLAGSGTAGFANGSTTSATFNGPQGVAVDSSGNAYVADTSNNVIRKITPAGVVSTYAGTGTAGFANGAAASAMFDYPEGVAVDSTGNVYVGDTLNEVIRKITPAGVVSTYAGTVHNGGFTNGPAASATFSVPDGVAVDSSGNVYVGDVGNSAIRKITPGGVVSTYAGTGTSGFTNGPAATATFAGPFGVAVDSAGNVYVADAANAVIREIVPSGVVSTYAGAGTGGATFSYPLGVAVDSSGNVYVADFGTATIRKISVGGLVTTYAGSGTQGFANGPSLSATFNQPNAVAVGGSGNVFVSERGNNAVRLITP